MLTRGSWIPLVVDHATPLQLRGLVVELMPLEYTAEEQMREVVYTSRVPSTWEEGGDTTGFRLEMRRRMPFSLGSLIKHVCSGPVRLVIMVGMVERLVED